MTNLLQAAQQAKGEIWQLEIIDLKATEVKPKTFVKTEKVDGKDVTKSIEYKVMIVNGKEYNIRDKQLNQIKEQVDKRPTLTKIRFMKLDDGKIICLPLD